LTLGNEGGEYIPCDVFVSIAIIGWMFDIFLEDNEQMTRQSRSSVTASTYSA